MSAPSTSECLANFAAENKTKAPFFYYIFVMKHASCASRHTPASPSVGTDD